MAVVNNNPQFNGNYHQMMPTGFADVNTPWQKYDPATAQLVRGTMVFSKDRLKELDPAYTGYTHIFVLRMPWFMELLKKNGAIAGYDDEAAAKAKYHYDNLKSLIELGTTSYSGTPNLSMDTADINVGWEDRNYSAPTKAQYSGNEFTLRMLETRGEPLRLAAEYYISSVFDPVGKFASMGGAKNPDTGKPLEPSIANYTFSIMVVQTDQTLLRIQNIDLWNNAFFTEIDRSNLDWEQGNINIVEPKELRFRGVYLPATDNKTCQAKALELLKTRSLFYKRIVDLTDADLRLDESTDALKGSVKL